MIFKKKKNYSDVEFQESFLPHNRKEELRFIFRNRKGLLLGMGGIFVLFSLPLLVTFLLRDFYLSRSYNLLLEGAITEEQFNGFINTNNLLFSLIAVVCIFILTIAFAGLFQIYKKLTFGEPVFFWYDFKKGLKNNIKPFLLISLILSIFISIFAVLFFFFGYYFWILIALGFFVLLILPIIVNMYFYSGLYSGSAKQVIANSLQLFLTAHFKGLVIFLGIIFIPVVSNILSFFLVITPAVNEFILMAFIFFLFPTFLLMQYLFCFSIFDEKINRVFFPDKYKIGLYNPKEKKGDSSNNENKVSK